MSEVSDPAQEPESSKPPVEQAPVAEEPTLRSRISTWLSKRALSSVIVAAVLALILGIGIGHVMDEGKGRHHRMERSWGDRDGRGPGFGGPDFGNRDGRGFGGPGVDGPQDRENRGPGMMPGGPGFGGPPPIQATPEASPSQTAQ